VSVGARGRAGSSAGVEWFEDEAFWTAYAPLMFDEKRWAEVPAVIDDIERLSSPPRGGAVLDACCGPGRHSLELASRGYRVTGIDIMEPFLEAARESAEAWGVKADFLQADLRSYSEPGRFDLAINLFTSFGYFVDPADDILALANIRASLRPGGVLVLETQGKEVLARDFSTGEWFERDGCTVLTEFSVVGAWEGLRNRWIILREEGAGQGLRAIREDRSFVIRLYSGAELRSALQSAGFAGAEIFGSLSGRPYDQNAECLVAVARC
jgi:SAM-dependent methyltransferase